MTNNNLTSLSAQIDNNYMNNALNVYLCMYNPNFK